MVNDIASWLVRAKVSPPRLPLNVCRREDLLHRLVADGNNRIVVLDAPAGFGKTLLLSQLREVHCSRGRRVAWLCVDETDEPEMFITYLAFAFHCCGVGMLETGLLSSSFHGVRTAYSLGRLLNRIEIGDADCVLILDDVERMRADTITDVLNPLLRIQPDNLRVCIAFRSNPGVSLSNLRVQGGLVTLLPGDLKFTRGEITRWFGGHLEGRLLDSVLERTAGWPVALQLVRIGTDPSKPLAEQLTRFAWTGREPATYIREQLLSQLSPPQAGFLRDTSILDSVRADIADSLRGTADSHMIMQQLHTTLEGIFVPLEDGEAWRFHPLIRECLFEELREAYPDRFRELNRAAATWLSLHGQGLSAMRHALLAGAPDQAAAIFEDMGASQLWLHEGMARLSAALALLADYKLRDFPRIQVARSLQFAKNGDMKSAREALENAKTVSGGFLHDREGGDDTALLIDGHFIELLLTEYGCAPTADALADDTWDVVIDYALRDPALHAYIMTWRCLINTQSGNFARAIDYGNKALCDFDLDQSRYGELFIYLHFGMVKLARGATSDALEQYDKAVRVHREEFPGDTGVKMICNIALGEAYWERGDYVNARRYLRQVAKQVRHAEAWFDLYMAAYYCCVRLLLTESGADAAFAYLEAAREHAVTQGLGRLENFLDAIQLLLMCDAGLEQEALAHAERHRDTLDPALRYTKQLTWRELEVFTLARIRVALLSKCLDAAERQIADLAGIAEATGNVRLQIHACIQRAVLAAAHGDRWPALDALCEAVVLARPGYYLRPLLDAPDAVAELLPVLKERCAAAPSRNETDLTEFIGDLAARTARECHNTLPESFSAREIQIIGELSRGRPDKLIARAIGLSAHGVRYHLKNIYSKLGVQNRVQAVSQARKMGLLQ